MNVSDPKTRPVVSMVGASILYIELKLGSVHGEMISQLVIAPPITAISDKNIILSM